MSQLRKTQKKRNGGMRNILPYDKFSALQYFIQNASFSIFSRGSSSIIVKAILNPSITSPYKATRIGILNDSVKEILFKFVVYNLHPNEECEIMSIPEEEFENEINIQKHIFETSFLNEDTFLEPICPCILHSTKILNDTHKQNFLSIMQKTMEHRDFQRIQQIFKHDIGYIAMECMNTYKPLETLEESPKFNFYVMFAVHQLRKMHNIGYKHCDLHLNNVLIDETYNYYDFMPGRAIIIDFSKSKMITKNDKKNLDLLIKRELSTEVSQTMINNIDYLDSSHKSLHNSCIKVIESRLPRPLKNYIELLLYRGGNMDKIMKAISKKDMEDTTIFHGKKGEWSLPSDKDMNKMFADVIMENMKKTNPEMYASLNNMISELETLSDDYIERLFYAQFNGMIVSDKLQSK